MGILGFTITRNKPQLDDMGGTIPPPTPVARPPAKGRKKKAPPAALPQNGHKKPVAKAGVKLAKMEAPPSLDGEIIAKVSVPDEDQQLRKFEDDEEQLPQPTSGDNELAEVLDYPFGQGIPIERISEISEEDILPFAIIKMQSYLPNLKGEESDPDLAVLFVHDLMEMTISLDREGRRELKDMIQGLVRKRQEESEADLYGKLK